MNNTPTTEREQEQAEKLEQYLADLERGKRSDLSRDARTDAEHLGRAAFARGLHYAKKDIRPRESFIQSLRQEIRKQSQALREMPTVHAEETQKHSWMSRLIPFSIAAASLAVIVLAAVSAKTVFQKQTNSNALVFLKEEAGNKLKELSLDDLATNPSPDAVGEPVAPTDAGETPDAADQRPATPPSNSNTNANTNENPIAAVITGAVAPDLSALLDEFDTDIVLAESDVEEQLVFAELDDLDLFMNDIEGLEF